MAQKILSLIGEKDREISREGPAAYIAARSIPEPNSGCWLWAGSIANRGYGSVRIGGRGIKIHRLSYEVAKGPIPDGLVIDHKCRTPWCVNPDHLRAVTIRENTVCGRGPSAVAAEATHCVKGHPFDADNTVILRKNGREWRGCKACRRAVRQAWEARRPPRDRRALKSSPPDRRHTTPQGERE